MAAPNQETIKNLESRKSKLLRALQLLGADETNNKPGFLNPIDNEVLEHLACRIPAFDEAAFSPEVARFVRDLGKESEPAYRRILASDLEFIELICANEEDLTRRGAFGLIQGGFPVRLHGQVVSCVWTGKMCDQPMTPEPLGDPAREPGFPSQPWASRAGKIPVFTAEQVEHIFALHRQWRDTVEQTLTAHLSLLDMNAQLLESERVPFLPDGRVRPDAIL